MKRKTLIVITVILAAIAAFAAGSASTLLLLNSRGAYATAGDSSIFARLAEVYDILMTRYYKEVDGDVLVQGAIDGMMASLGDPYTFYYTPEEMESEFESMNGEYVGIGMLLALTHENTLVAQQIYRNSPAEKAGLRAGDQLLRVYDEDVSHGTQEMLNHAANIIRGEEGTQVQLTVLRDGKEVVIDITRGRVEIEYAYYEMRDDGLMYLNLSGFNGNAARIMKEALESANANGCKGVLIDLRSNPGGQLGVVLDCLDLVIPKGLLVYLEDREGAREEYFSDSTYDPIPIAVLIDENSASASELFTGAVKDYDRGVVVGKKSFGKGIVQTVHSFINDGAGLQYTSEVYYTPSGVCIHGSGIMPDIEIEDDPETEFDEALEEAARQLLK